jgi:aldehyde:ferredoxin oxidoreductase
MKVCAAYRVLHINLDDHSYHIETFDETYTRRFLGGRGITSYILYRDVPPKADPYGPGNILAFTPGALGATNAPTAARTTVTSKSPATNLFMKTSMGGHWGARLRYAGYDALIIHGNSSRWVNIIISDDSVRFEPAGQYLGLSVTDTTLRIVEDHADLPELAVCCIGPAGENLVKFAAIFSSVYNTAGRGGLGAVMGAKKLKAICCSGRQGQAVHDPLEFMAAVRASLDRIRSVGRCAYYKEYGTAGGMIGLNESGILPVRNFQLGYMQNVYNISGHALTEKGYLVRRDSCFACTISCKRYSKTLQEYPGCESGGPEYETISVFGAGCMVDRMDPCLRANYLVNLYGLDSISAGSVIQWAMETAEKGLLPKTFADPATGTVYTLEFGNADTMLILIEMIAYKRGLGALLAEGVKSAARQVGGDSWKWAVEDKGLEMSRVETRVAKGYGLAFATNPRGPDHLYGQPMAECGFSPEMREIIQKITGSESYAVSSSTKKKPEIVTWHEEIYAMTDALGLCSRATLSTYALTPEHMTRLFRAATGIDIDEAGMFEAARRIINLERSYNIREGFGKGSDRLPWRLMNESITRPNKEVHMNSAQEMDMMLEGYYHIRGWDCDGWPTRATIAALGLDDIIKEEDYNHAN